MADDPRALMAEVEAALARLENARGMLADACGDDDLPVAIAAMTAADTEMDKHAEGWLRSLLADVERLKQERTIAQSNAEAVSAMLIDQGDRAVAELAACRRDTLELAIQTVYHLPFGEQGSGLGAATAQDAIVALHALQESRALPASEAPPAKEQK